MGTLCQKSYPILSMGGIYNMRLFDANLLFGHDHPLTTEKKSVWRRFLKQLFKMGALHAVFNKQGRYFSLSQIQVKGSR
jgi:hypothetical protein